MSLHVLVNPHPHFNPIPLSTTSCTPTSVPAAYCVKYHCKRLSPFILSKLKMPFFISSRIFAWIYRRRPTLITPSCIFFTWLLYFYFLFLGTQLFLHSKKYTFSTQRDVTLLPTNQSHQSIIRRGRALHHRPRGSSNWGNCSFYHFGMISHVSPVPCHSITSLANDGGVKGEMVGGS